MEAPGTEVGRSDDAADATRPAAARRPRRFGLRLTLGLYVVGFGVILLVLSGVVSLRAEAELERRDSETRVVALLRALAVPCTTAMARNDTALLHDYLSRFIGVESLDVRYVTVLDTTGRVVAHTEVEGLGSLQADDFARAAVASTRPVTRLVEDHDGPVLEVAIPLSTTERVGTLRGGFTLAPADRALARTRWRLFWSGILSLLGSASFAYLLISGLVVRPLLRMGAMARAIAAGNLDARIAVEGDDEIGELADGMNALATRIQDHTQRLEQLVAERTTELQRSNTMLLGANQQLERLARTDALTGLYNRRHVLEQLEFEIRRGSRVEHQFTLAMIDVDHFKLFNDTHGHSAGDEVLVRLAIAFQANLRSTDVIARYGGEEFLVLLLDTGPEEGLTTARKLQRLVEELPIPRAHTQPGGHLTVSVGIAFYPRDATEARSLIDHADEALYRSKQQGRNRVTAWTVA